MPSVRDSNGREIRTSGGGVFIRVVAQTLTDLMIDLVIANILQSKVNINPRCVIMKTLKEKKCTYCKTLKEKKCTYCKTLKEKKKDILNSLKEK